MKIWQAIGAPLLLAEGVGLLIVGFIHVAHAENGKLRFLLIDDAMISMCYARSLVEGCGLVWYCGAEKVEGFTNFLWTLYMAFWHWLGFKDDWGALPILLTGLVTIAMQIYWLYRLGEDFGGERVGQMTAWVGAAFFPLIRWHVSGMETGLLTLLLTYLLYRALKVKQQWPVVTLILISIGVLVRMDFGVWAAAIAAYVAYRERSWRLWWEVFLVVGLASGSLTLFRWLYYGEFLPNTHYIKVQLVPWFYRVINGLLSFGKYAYVNAALFLLVAYAFWKRRLSTSEDRLMWVSALAGFLYNLYAGGDAWETPSTGSRFLLMSSISLFALSGYTLGRLGLAMRIVGLATVLMGTPSPKLTWESIRMYHFYKMAVEEKERDNVRWYNFVLNPEINLTSRVSPKSVIAIIPAGTYPYFYRIYDWIDLLGLCSKHNAFDTIWCSRSTPPPLLYMPGHTHAGWQKAIEKADVLFLSGLECEQRPELRSFEWRCKVSWLAPNCCEQAHYSGMFQDRRRMAELCRIFYKDPSIPHLYRKLHWEVDGANFPKNTE